VGADYRKDVSRNERLLLTGQLTLLAVSAVFAVMLSRTADWQPLPLLGLLLLVALVSELFPIESKTGSISCSFLAIALAMTLLGPSPAVAIAVSAILLNALRRRVPLRHALVNLSIYASFPVFGGVLFALTGGPDLAATDPPSYVVAVFLLFMGMNTLNFLLVAIDIAVVDGLSLPQSVRAMFLPMLPMEFAVGLLTAGVAYVYSELGLSAIGLLAVVCLVFQYLLRTGVNSIESKEQLESRTTQLASLQVGLLTTVLQTLSLRDKMTARHSAAVARYARQMARALGMSDHEQEIVHTAGLLHDIGKFIFPDAILLADTKLTDEQFEIVRKHPEQGAKLVRRIDGYGPIADIIHAHHERIDGRGYPRGLPADEIPIAARMISIADTYDVMTSRDSYRKPVSPAEAIAELRRVSGSQLDGALVELFIELVEKKNIGFKHADEAEFESELNFESRVRDYAAPRPLAA
jgi:putative nucleotidyltransferase with HDIG domain